MGPGYDPETIKHWDHQYLWHPFTDMQEYIQQEPVVIRRGEGVRLQDVDGRWYYDGVASIWLNVHGHHVPALDQAIREQLDQLAHSTLLGQANLPAVLLAKELVAIAPDGLSKVFFSDSGATAVEIAMKMAIQYWKNRGHATKRYIVGFSRNYHGDTFGAMAIAPDPVFHWPFLDILPENPRVAYPYCYRCPLDLEFPQCQLACQESLESLLAQRAHEIAAVIVEPVEGAGGIIPAPPGYLSRLQDLCRRFDVLLIVDEVATGFGRTGTLFACEQDGVTPDILCLAKGITGGYLPLAATLASDRIFQAFLGRPEEKKSLFHGHSYTGNALGCAVALANLSLMPGVMAMLPEKVDAIRRGLEAIKPHPLVGDVRQAGFMVGIELVRDRHRKEPFDAIQKAGWVVAGYARQAGLLIRPLGNVVVFMPPLASTVTELEDMLTILKGALDAAQGRLLP